MTALTANRDDLMQDGQWLAYPVKTGTTIYAGGAVGVDSTGYLVNITDAANTVYVGQALDYVANTGASGAATCRVRTSGVAQFAYAPGNATQATVGQKVYAVDNQTVNTSTTNSVYVGRVVSVVSAGVVRVKLGAA